MAKAEKLQTNFNAGELSPYLEGRPDVAKFFNGARQMENVLLLPEGGFTRCPGTRWVRSTKNDGQAILVPFVPTITNPIMLEFGNLYIRFHKSTGTIVDGGGTPIEVVSPYTTADLDELAGGQGMRQSVDVLFIDHSAYAPRKLIYLADTNWTLSLLPLNPPPTYEADTNLAEVLAPAANTGNGIRFYAKSGIFLAADVGRQIISGISRAIIKTLVSAVEVTADIITDFAATITAGPGTITTLGTALTCSVAHGLAVNDYVTATNGAQAGQIRKVMAVPTSTTATLDAAFPADIAVGATWNKVTGIASGSWTLRGSPQTTVDLDKKEPVGTSVAVVAAANAFRNADVGKYIKLYGGVVKLTIFSDALNMTGEIKSVLSDALANPAATSSWRLEVETWSNARGWPRANDFHEGRLWHAGAASDPTTVIGSASGNYEDYGIGSLASRAVQYTHASGEFDRTNWLVSAQSLFFGNGRGEVRMRGPALGEPLGGDKIPEVKEQSFRGSALVRPMKVDDSFIFVGKTWGKVYADRYDVATDKFKALNITKLARHITEHTSYSVRQGLKAHRLQYAQDPLPVIYLIRNDGVLLCLTYDEDDGILGFTRRVFDNQIESVGVMPHVNGDRDQAWVIVNRTINGATKRYIEIFEDNGHSLTQAKWAPYFTDAAIKITKSDTASQTVITGLNHLIAKTVDVLMYRTDLGSAQSPRYLGPYVVSAAGEITLTEAVSFTCIFEIGLHYTWTVQTMRPAIANEMVEGHTRKWVSAYLRLYKSIPPKINGEQMKINVGGDPMDQGPQLVSADRKVMSDQWQYDKDGYLTMTGDLPFPCTVLSLFGEVQFSEKI